MLEVKNSAESGFIATAWDKRLADGLPGDSDWGDNWKWAGFEKAPNGSALTAVREELAQGWPEGCKLINDARRDVLNAAVSAPTNRRLKASHGHATGFNPNVSAMIQGMPNPFSQWERKPKATAIRLMCELSAASGASASALVWRGAATLVLADLFQEAGYNVEIWACNTNGLSNGEALCTGVLVKGAEEVTIPDQLASILVSPRFYRVAMIRHVHFAPYRVEIGHGSCLTLDPSLLAGTELDDLKDCIYIVGCFSKAEAVTEINRVVKELNNGSEKD